MNVDGAIVLVTGGARGIGRALGETFARAGVSVVIADLDGDLVETVAREIGCRGCRLDVTDAQSSEKLVSDIVSSIGPVDILVNNAGIMPLGSHSTEPDGLTRRIFDVNVLGPMRLTRLVLPSMLQRSAGWVVNVASSAGVSATAGGVSYSASKAASMRWSEGLRRELRGTGVGVTAVMPGIVRTDLSTGLTDARGLPTVTPQHVADRVVRAVERGRPEVWVPRRLRLIPAFLGLAPRKANDLLIRGVGGDRLFAEPDAAARLNYERRVRSDTEDREPSTDPR